MLVSQNMAKREAPIKRASRHSEAPHRQIQQLGNLNVLRPGPAPGLTLLMQQNLKRLMKWFSCWHAWQRRMVVCRMLDSCPPAQLTSLATALEPVLHLDFCSSLAPLKAALHHEGLEIFVVQRATNSYQFQQWNTEAQGFRQALHKPEKVKQYLSKSAQFPAHSSQEENEELISKKPAQTVASLPILRSSIEKEELHHVRPPVFLPTLEMMHSRHKVSPASSDYRHPSDLQEEKETLVLPLLTLQHKYNSVPDFRNNSDLLQHIKLVGSQDHHRKSKSLGVHLQDHTRRRPRKARTSNKTRHLELYKKQLGLVSQWMSLCSTAEKARLILEVVKVTDKELLGYLVQCLYQRIQQTPSINSLTDPLLMKIFNSLDATSICHCIQVCQRWRYLCSTTALWKELCFQMGLREGLGDIVSAIEVVHRVRGDNKTENTQYGVDWKQAYRDLSRLMGTLKSAVIKAAREAEERTMKEAAGQARPYTSAELCSSMTLREMLDVLRSTGQYSSRPTTQELFQSAPESVSAMRHRLRAERAEAARQSSNVIPSYKQQLSGDEEESEDRVAGSETIMRFTMYGKDRTISTKSIELLDVALDRRPGIPLLPCPEGIKCLVLAGFLSSRERPRPGRTEPIPRLRRQGPLGSEVLCLQCDERKIVAGTADRLIRVYDIRSGRLVEILHGHKGSVQCLQFDEQNIVSGSWDTTLMVWDVVSFSVVHTLCGHTECVSCLRFNGSTLISGSYDKSLRIWDMLSWTCVQCIAHAHKGKSSQQKKTVEVGMHKRTETSC